MQSGSPSDWAMRHGADAKSNADVRVTTIAPYTIVQAS